ncbi:unnamed protein product [Didymodactylos carnosus]|uniref:Uncharacterized protein n=1 Tax=Didymodactylos carnosus TaxID=1234261 RepID=A0A814JYJ5_9BILA|nr:unnamed protein product [Didymodactylos carnosus]CAF1042100.1 unnamed protein product [Didymodactylos carnosus]CAF3650037.1 unnamed protein product [Didymodactylos carnosus]CAF3812299.1 unnamed protein product [Didymodactylos carnosus]
MVSLLAVHVKRMDYPTNFILLGLFTLFESFTIGTLVSFFDKFLVVQALIITSVIVCCLTMYTFQTKRDFSTMGAGLFAFLSVLFAGVLLQIFLQSPVMDIVLAMAGALLFSGFLIYDTQQIMRKCSPEEYIVGAITIYLDITRLFIEILRILEALRQK